MPEPTAEACKRRDELVGAACDEKGSTWSATNLAFALYIDEVDRVARELKPYSNETAVNLLRSIMLPDPVDPLVEAIRQTILTDADDADGQRLRAALAKRGLHVTEIGNG